MKTNKLNFFLGTFILIILLFIYIFCYVIPITKSLNNLDFDYPNKVKQLCESKDGIIIEPRIFGDGWACAFDGNVYLIINGSFYKK